MDEKKVALYYHYCEICDVESEKRWQVSVSERLGLLGRIRVAGEGLNGTLGGEPSAVDEYVELMLERELFSDMDFKFSTASTVPFSSLLVDVRSEVVTTGVNPEQLPPQSLAAQHLTPPEFHEEMLKMDEELVVLDVRNVYEAKVGQFEGAVIPPTRQFSDFPKVMPPLVDELGLRDKKVLMYCTGGVRCERASALLRSYGVENVYQLQGGIHSYLDTFPNGGLFRGKNFVFDERIALPPPNRVGEVEVFGRCDQCSNPYDDYSANRRCRHCRILVLVCDDCAEKMESFVCGDCPALVPRRKKTRAKRRLRQLEKERSVQENATVL